MEQVIKVSQQCKTKNTYAQYFVSYKLWYFLRSNISQFNFVNNSISKSSFPLSTSFFLLGVCHWNHQIPTPHNAPHVLCSTCKMKRKSEDKKIQAKHWPEHLPLCETAKNNWQFSQKNSVIDVFQGPTLLMVFVF